MGKPKFAYYTCMRIDLANFTPIPSLIGGIIIGFAVVLYFYATGRLVGVSGIANNTLIKKENRFTNLIFLIGLITGPIIYKIFISEEIPFFINDNLITIILGGLLVGIGTQIGMGCTSGHGVVGISRFSKRSLIATLCFIFSGVIIVYLMNSLGFGI